MMKHTLLPALLLAALPLNAAPPPKIDVSRMPQQSRVIGDVIVPVPSEIFSVLDKLGRPRWTEFMRPAQIDPWGWTNNVCIGPYARPRMRLPGAAGIPDAVTTFAISPAQIAS